MNRLSRDVGAVSSAIGTPSCDHADIVIVGNGIAGLTAAIEARRLAPEKHIAIITEQTHPTDLGGLSLLTVGNPLSEIEGDECLTESSKGHYRRISVRDDQLVGYLSLGPTQSDSLAIKRIIDEGRSIRDIKQALLKGNFDARQYFSQGQQRSHTVPAMIITGKLAVPSSLILSSPRTDALYDTDPLLPPLIAEGKNNERESKDSEVSLQNGFGSLPTPIQEARTLEQREPVKRSTPVISSFKSLMNKQFDLVKWVVPEVLPQGLIALVDKQRIGKSWLDLALGLAVARGDLVFGRIKVQQGHVLYLALEDDERRLQERLGKLLVPAAIPPDGFEFATAWPRMDTDGLAAVEAWLVSHPQARLVIIDPWLKVKPGAEHKDGATTSAADHEALIGLKQLAHTYKVCILVQFHTRKAAATNALDGLHIVTNLAAYVDGILSLKRAPGEEYATLSGSGRAYVQDVHLALAFNGRDWEIIGNAAPCLLSQTHRAIIDVLNARGKPMKPKEIAQALGKADGTIRKLLYEMKGSGVVRATEQGYLALLPEQLELTARENSSHDGNCSSKSNDGNSLEPIIMQQFSTVTSTGPLAQELSLELC